MIELVFQREIISTLLLTVLAFAVPVREGGYITTGAECAAAALDDDCVCEVRFLPFLYALVND